VQQWVTRIVKIVSSIQYPTGYQGFEINKSICGHGQPFLANTSKGNPPRFIFCDAECNEYSRSHMASFYQSLALAGLAA
jgi:hypothetical protein